MTRRSCSILDEGNSTPGCRRCRTRLPGPRLPRPYMGAEVRRQRRRALKPTSSRARRKVTNKPCSIGGRQPADDKLDPVVGDLAPRFNLGHIGRFGEALEPFARLGARFVARQAKGLAAPGVLCGGRVRTSAAPISDAL